MPFKQYTTSTATVSYTHLDVYKRQANTIDRVIDAFPPGQQQQIRAQLSMVLDAVISQQLIPTADGTLDSCTRICCCWWGGKTSITRSTVLAAPMVCSVESTRCPVSAAVMATLMVS